MCHHRHRHRSRHRISLHCRITGPAGYTAQDSAATGDGLMKKTWKAADGVAYEQRILELLADLERKRNLVDAAH